MSRQAFAWFGDAENYSVVEGASESDAEFLEYDFHLDAVREPVNLKKVIGRKKERPLSDFPETGVAFPRCMSERAYESLRTVLDRCGVVRRAQLADDTFVLFWPSLEIDCLDTDRCEFQARAGGNRRLVKAAFSSELDNAEPIFIVPGFRTQCVFVKDEFVTAVKDNQLAGLELWLDFHNEPEIIRV